MLELTLRPSHAAFDADDDRFGTAVKELLDTLADDAGRAELRDVPAHGKKGTTAEIILALGTSGAIGAALAAFKSWLERDKARAIAITVRENNSVREVTVTADSASVKELDKLLKTVRST